MSIEDQYIKAKNRLNGRLFAPYQSEGVLWMLSMENQVHGPKGGFLCDEMGLGKTVQVVSTMLGNEKRRTLIVVPKSIVTQWVHEIKKFAPDLSVGVYNGSNMLPYDVVICSYSLIVNDCPLHSISWDRVVLDEAHEIRNRASKTFKSVRALRTNIRWIVTGTPVFNSMNDFVSLCEFLGIEKTLVQGMTSKIKDIYILRRTKEDLANIDKKLELPPCSFENVELEMFSDERKLYEFVFKDAQDTIKDIFKSSLNINAKNMAILECLLRARQCMIWPQMYLDGMARKNNTEPERWIGRSNKMETLFRMIHAHPDEKTLVFCQFMGEMNFIERVLEELGYTTFRIDGSCSNAVRQQQVEGFRKAGPGAIFIIQIKSGGQGLNLQEATRVYITAPSWNPATELQAIGRAHRTGQTKPVYVKKLIYKETDEFISVEEEMMALQGHKSLVCSHVLNDQRLQSQIPVKRTCDKISILDIKKIFRA